MPDLNHITCSPSLTDSFQRIHNYLRISLTDKCNMRCKYCMPHEDMHFFPTKQLMTAEEIFRMAHTFVALGVQKIRLTGGEPLLRADANDILQKLASLPVELLLTTNAVHLGQQMDMLWHNGIRSVNISIDSLQESRFNAVTQRNYFGRVMNNIYAAIEYGFHVKLNVVVMRDFNHDELCDFVSLTRDLPVHVRFIEFMPFDGNGWTTRQLYSYQDMLQSIRNEFTVEKIADAQHSTAKKYQVPGFTGTFAFITTMSEVFCGDCNRLRLTADGKMKNCLFSATETDLLSALRNGEDIRPLICACIADKKASMGGQTNPMEMINRSMIQIGG